MRSRFLTSMACLGVIAAGFAVFRTPEPASAQSPSFGESPVVFRITIEKGDATPHVLMTVPPSRTLYVRDIWANGFEVDAGADKLFLLADDEVRFTMPVGETKGADRNYPFSMAVGLAFSTGQEVAVKRANIISNTNPLDLYIAGVLRAN